MYNHSLLYQAGFGVVLVDGSGLRKPHKDGTFPELLKIEAAYTVAAVRAESRLGRGLEAEHHEVQTDAKNLMKPL